MAQPPYANPFARVIIASWHCASLAPMSIQVEARSQLRDDPRCAAALLIPETTLVLEAVGLNPTRSALIDFLISMGARIKVLNIQQTGGELIGDLRVSGGTITGGAIEKSLTASLIDEIPVLAVL